MKRIYFLCEKWCWALHDHTNFSTVRHKNNPYMFETQTHTSPVSVADPFILLVKPLLPCWMVIKVDIVPHSLFWLTVHSRFLASQAGFMAHQKPFFHCFCGPCSFFPPSQSFLTSSIFPRRLWWQASRHLKGACSVQQYHPPNNPPPASEAKGPPRSN